LFIIVTQVITTNVCAAGNDDSNHKEVGIEWVEDYSNNPDFNDLNYCKEDAEGFYNKLKNNGFTGKWNYGDRNAKEKHFEKSGVNGQDSSYADDVDFVYFAGHGTPPAFHFGTNQDGDGQSYIRMVHYTEADWGDKDLEWIFIAACRVLQAYPTRWDPAFHSPKTLHGITGFHTGADDNPYLGDYFATYLLGGSSIINAWRNATKLSQASSRWAAIYAVVAQFPPPQPTKHWWDEQLQALETVCIPILQVLAQAHPLTLSTLNGNVR